MRYLRVGEEEDGVPLAEAGLAQHTPQVVQPLGLAIRLGDLHLYRIGEHIQMQTL